LDLMEMNILGKQMLKFMKILVRIVMMNKIQIFIKMLLLNIYIKLPSFIDFIINYFLFKTKIYNLNILLVPIKIFIFIFLLECI
jgi:hypothetical protein